MADTFYAKYTSLYDADNTTAWDDIVLQFELIEKLTRNHTTNLLVHGYDESKKSVWADPETGAAPLVWSRAVGWYMVALLETIPLLPASHEGRDKLTGYFQTLAEGVLKAQDAATAGWWLIMDFPGRQKNYIESSASAMFTFSLLRGVRLGLIDADTYLAPAQKAYQALVDDFVVEKADGTLDWEGTVLVGSLNSNATFEVRVFLNSQCLISNMRVLTDRTDPGPVLHVHCAVSQRLQGRWAVHVRLVRNRDFVKLILAQKCGEDGRGFSIFLYISDQCELELT